MIPHTIHYFWFGGGDKPEAVKKCIDSWKKSCPGFEIKEWNEDNYDVHKHPFMERAYNDRKWAFVSDYARLDKLYNYGGIYLDTDVEVIKDLSPLCEYDGYIGFEREDLVGDGAGFGGRKGLPVFKEMMECYKDEDSYPESPLLRTKVLLLHGLKTDGKRQTVADMEIFPTDYFCPKNYRTGEIKLTPNTYSIHHFDGSWKGENQNENGYLKLLRFLCRTFGEKGGKRIFDALVSVKDALLKVINR